MTNGQILQTLGGLLANAQRDYRSLAQICDSSYAALWAGGSTPTTGQQAQVIGVVTGMGTTAAALFTEHYYLSCAVLAYEKAMGITRTHAWEQGGTPGIPSGWTSTAVLDDGGNPTGALTLSYTPTT